MPMTTPTERPDRHSTRHAGVTRDDVVDAALAIVRDDGGDALTMRGLAGRLGVAPTTVYWHVGNRDELVLAVVRRQAERQAGARVRGSTPAERIVHATLEIWHHALASRNVTALANQVGATTLLELPLEVALVSELEAAGLHDEVARDALRALLACIAGFLVLAWRSDQPIPEPLRSESLWAAVEHPTLTDGTRAALATRDDGGLEANVARTIRALVDALLASTASRAEEASR